MLDLVTEAVTALQAETSTYPQNVQIWMKLMAVSFLVSIVFVYSRVGARWILARNTMGRVAIGRASFISRGWENLLRLGLYCLARMGLFIDVDISCFRFPQPDFFMGLTVGYEIWPYPPAPLPALITSAPSCVAHQ